ncbi:MAG: hypothetical protein R2814_04690 [Flavobacteriaceae bacterium]
MKIVLSIVLLHFFLNGIYSQMKENYYDRAGHFVIKKHSYISENYSSGDLENDSEKNIQAPSNLYPPPLPPPQSRDEWDFSLHFLIMPTYYTQYIVPNDFKMDSTVTHGVLEIIRVDRNSLNRTEFQPLRFEIYETEENGLKPFDNYKIIKENRADTKIIAGRECFQVIVDIISNGYSMELYVTESIELNYHPIMNFKEILDKYFPLYVRIFNEKFPDQEYDEYIFLEY